MELGKKKQICIMPTYKKQFPWQSNIFTNITYIRNIILEKYYAMDTHRATEDSSSLNKNPKP